METFFVELLERLTALHRDLETAVSDLPPTALDWVPGPDMNSLNVLVTHTCGAERYWIGDMAGQDSSDRVRATEFESSGLTEKDLTELLHKTLAHNEGVLTRLDVKDLGKVIESEAHAGRTYSIAWCLLHALEHTAQHVGHVQMLRQLWDQRE